MKAVHRCEQVWAGLKETSKGWCSVLGLVRAKKLLVPVGHGNTPRWMAVGQGIQQVLELGKCVAMEAHSYCPCSDSVLMSVIG